MRYALENPVSPTNPPHSRRLLEHPALGELASRLEGRSVLGTAQIGRDETTESLSLPEDRRPCASLPVDALHRALEDCIALGVDLTPVGTDDPQGVHDQQGVLVGMSGGVDSTVAALELKNRGYRVVGVTFRHWVDPACLPRRGSSSLEILTRAQRMAHRLGIPHLTVNLEDEFRQRVVERFVADYADARTPNPCTRCNADLRFPALIQLADRLGLGWVATGHYARLSRDTPRLRRGAEAAKDQSYFLAEVNPNLLARVLFPLGEMSKADVRARARAVSPEMHEAPDSQEICFIPDNDYRRFLRARLGEQPGRLVDQNGKCLGTHRGLYNFTIGQRRRLGLHSSVPLYVTALLPEEGTVVVGPSGLLDVWRLAVRSLKRHAARLPTKALLQVRSTGPAVPVKIQEVGQDEITVVADKPLRGVAPGQSAVLYEGDYVLCAGTIAPPDG